MHDQVGFQLLVIAFAAGFSSHMLAPFGLCKNIQKQLDSSEKIEEIIKKYKFVTKQYTKRFTKINNVDYIKMIKMEVDYDLMSEQCDTYKDIPV